MYWKKLNVQHTVSMKRQNLRGKRTTSQLNEIFDLHNCFLNKKNNKTNKCLCLQSAATIYCSKVKGFKAKLF